VALVHLERAVALNPRLAEAQYNLGHALSLLERPDAAIPHLRHALELRPAYPEAHFDLGMALGARDDVVGAVEHLAAAARLAPASAGAHKYLALALTSHGDVAAAVPHFREALRLSSDDVAVMHNLAAIESTHPDIGLRDGADAVRLEERARVLTSGQNAIVLMGLGAAYAEVGRFDDARAMVQQAIERASADGASDLVDRGRRTLVLFSAHRPFRQDFSPQPRHGADELPRDAR
jgi:tetratricopeptide (TPR) repeat protein